MTRHLLVTNDFPPKVGGIQQYLWELWRRLEPTSFEVLTTPYAGDAAFDSEQGFAVHRSREPVLLPHPAVVRRVNEAADRCNADLIVVDPAVPLGIVGPHLNRPYAVVLHGAEVTIPGRLPGSAATLRRVLTRAIGVISAGEYALAEAERCARQSLDHVIVPPGVDVQRFAPLSGEARANVRSKYDIGVDQPFVLSVSRLVPRKGMDTLISAAARLSNTYPELIVGIAGSGRDQQRLQRKIDQLDAPVRLLGRVPEEHKADLYGSADVFAMLCRNRWGGLEQEGFGIVFLEAAAAGVAQVAGRSGGASEAVSQQRTGLIVDATASPAEAAASLDRLLSDPHLRRRMAADGRDRVVEHFSYDVLAERLSEALDTWAMASPARPR